MRAPHRFYNLLLSWGHRPYVARSRDGRMIGYLVAQADRTGVTELLAVNEGEPELEIAAAWVQRYGTTSFRVAAVEPPLAQAVPAQRRCECIEFGQLADFRLGGDARCLAQDARRAGAPDGWRGRRGGLRGYGRVVLEVRGDDVQCVLTEAEAALQMDTFTAMRLLCGPLRPLPRVAPACGCCPT